MLSDTDITRLHERLDTILERQSTIAEDVAAIKATCGPCRAIIDKHDDTLYGNGKPGLVSRLAVSEVGRTDTLSVKAIVGLIGAAGTLFGAIGAAIATILKAH